MSHQQVLPSVKHESNPNSTHNLSGEEWAVTQTKQKLPKHLSPIHPAGTSVDSVCF